MRKTTIIKLVCICMMWMLTEGCAHNPVANPSATSAQANMYQAKFLDSIYLELKRIGDILEQSRGPKETVYYEWDTIENTRKGRLNMGIVNDRRYYDTIKIRRLPPYLDSFMISALMPILMPNSVDSFQHSNLK